MHLFKLCLCKKSAFEEIIICKLYFIYLTFAFV